MLPVFLRKSAGLGLALPIRFWALVGHRAIPPLHPVSKQFLCNSWDMVRRVPDPHFARNALSAKKAKNRAKTQLHNPRKSKKSQQSSIKKKRAFVSLIRARGTNFSGESDHVRIGEMDSSFLSFLSSPLPLSRALCQRKGKRQPPSPIPAATPTSITDPETANPCLARHPCRQMRRRRSGRVLRGHLFGSFYGLFFSPSQLHSSFLTTKNFPPRIRDLAAALTSLRPVQAGIYAIGFAIITWGVGFAVKLLRRFFAREHQYGMSNQTFGAWFGESLKAARYRRSSFLPIVFAILYFNLSSGPTHLVDLGNHLRNHPYYVSQHGGSGFSSNRFLISTLR